MDIQGLKLRLLPASTIIKGFVKNDPKCNYEYYLVELLNNSEWFSTHYPKKFIWCPNQSQGECDAYSDDYGLDFKLIAAKTRLQASSIFSPQIDVITDGVVSYSASKVRGKTIPATRLHAALRGNSVEALKTIRTEECAHQGVESDLQTYLETLETPKNLMLFFPYRFRFVEDLLQTDPVGTVIKALNHDFNQSLVYRASQAPNYDTFFVTIYCNDFILCKVNNDTACYIESIPTDKCPTFVHLSEYQNTEDTLAEKDAERILKEWTR